ncbi:hypothetical protein ANCDUO_14854, partial [Ancylostoma duodenale]
MSGRIISWKLACITVERPDPQEVIVSVDAIHAGTAKGKPSGNAEPLSDVTSHWPSSHSASIHRTWNSKMYDAESGIARFPITSPMNKARHQKSKRTSGTLPLSLSCARTGGVHERGTILPSDSQNCIYRPPPVYDVWHQKFVHNDGITHTYNPAFPYDNVTNKGNAYDNAPAPGYSRWSHDCSCSAGRKDGPLMITAVRSQGGAQTLPHCKHKIYTAKRERKGHTKIESMKSVFGIRDDNLKVTALRDAYRSHRNAFHLLTTGRPRLRPSLEKTFAATFETPLEERRHSRKLSMCLAVKAAKCCIKDSNVLADSSFTLRGREDSLGLSHSPHLSSRDPSVTFACSTLGRSASPDTFSRSTPTGRAPLAMPEELTGSTSTSILSSSVSPERDPATLRTASDASTAAYSPTHPLVKSGASLERNARSSTDFSLSTLTISYSDGPPSPDSIRSKSGLDEKPASSSSNPLFNATTESSDSTMISSCSLPLVTKLSTTSPSGDDASTSSGVKLRSQWEGVSSRNLERGSSKGSENQSINELDEWNK